MSHVEAAQQAHQGQDRDEAGRASGFVSDLRCLSRDIWGPFLVQFIRDHQSRCKEREEQAMPSTWHSCNKSIGLGAPLSWHTED